MNEQTVEQIAAQLANAAAIAGDIPSPASVPLLLFAGLEGPVLQGIVWLVHKLHHAKDPVAAVKAANVAIDPYVDTTSLYAG